MRFKIFIRIIALLLILAGCTKEVSKEFNNENVAAGGTMAVASRLTNGAWIFSDITLKYDNGDIDDDSLDICKTDDLYKYETNGDATITHGVFPCSIDPSNGKYADWKLIENGTKLKETFTRDVFGETAGNIVIYKVEFISDSKLIVSRIIVEPGKTYTEISTYIR